MATKSAKKATPEMLTLNDEQAAKFDQLEKKAAVKARGDKAGRECKQLKEELSEIFGESRLARHPDGRLIQRTTKSWKRGPQKASDGEYDIFTATDE